MNNTTEIIVVLDRSGSMSSILTGTIEGFNTFLKEQKNAAGEAFMTLVQFDDQYQIDYKSVNVKHLEGLNTNNFVPRGSTALHDAIGKTINETKTDKPVVFVIITDGLENASREFRAPQIKALIEQKTKEGWKFVYLGANQDAVLVGESMGIHRGQTMSYGATSVDTVSAFASTASNTKAFRSAMAQGMSLQDAEENLLFSKKQRDDAMKGS